MAHRMLEEFIVPAAAAPPGTNPRGTFDQTERSVIVLSRTDPLSSLADPRSWQARLLSCLGRKMSNKLADARLEALRRYAIILRVQGRADDDELTHFLKAGFLPEQAVRLEQMVAPWRNRSLPASAVLRWIALGVAAALVDQAAARALDEQMIALVISGLFFVVLAPLMLPGEDVR